MFRAVLELLVLMVSERGWKDAILDGSRDAQPAKSAAARQAEWSADQVHGLAPEKVVSNGKALRKRVSWASALAGGTFSMMAIEAVDPVLVVTLHALQMVDRLVGMARQASMANHLLAILVHATYLCRAGAPTFARTRRLLVVLRHFHSPHKIRG